MGAFLSLPRMVHFLLHLYPFAFHDCCELMCFLLKVRTHTLMQRQDTGLCVQVVDRSIYTVTSMLDQGSLCFENNMCQRCNRRQKVLELSKFDVTFDVDQF